MRAIEIAFWVSVALIVYAHLGYPAALWLLARLRRRLITPELAKLPRVSLIIAAHNEAEVIERKVANALELDYPGEHLEVVLASDGSSDGTAERAREAGADLVLELPRAGKVPAQNAAVERARGEVLAFSDANAFWERGALRRLVARFGDPRVGYVCGQLRLVPAGSAASDADANEEGLYWRYEMALRELESGLGGVTAGNGAIYAVRRDAYIALPAAGSHDLSLPFQLSKRGWRAVYAPDAIATERMVSTIGGEFARKRRMMRGLWDEVVAHGMLSPRGYGALYAFQIASHRVLRYTLPLLHLIALGANIVLLGEGAIYSITLAAQLALLAGAALSRFVPFRPFRLARYYVLMTASIAAGLWDRMRLGTPGAWERTEGTR